MELLETQSPEKKKLIETSDRHKAEMKKEVKAITDKTERWITNAVIIGGSLALTYFVVSQLSSGSKKKKSRAKIKEAGEPETEQEDDNLISTPSVISQVANKVINQASFILLELAKEKLLEYLASRNQRNENS